MWNGTQSVGESSSSTSLSSQQDVEDDRMIAFVLSEEYAKLDGAVAKRLSNLAPVPHVPRINTYIPNLCDASLDHQRLLQRLQVYGLCEVKVSGDGNCQFRALSEQMYKSPEYHKHVRKEIVKQDFYFLCCLGCGVGNLITRVYHRRPKGANTEDSPGSMDFGPAESKREEGSLDKAPKQLELIEVHFPEFREQPAGVGTIDS